MEELLKNEFNFYSKLAKPLVLNLPKSKDRILAAAWIKKFRDVASGDERLRTIYLKLLLFCLQRRRLAGIFSDDPANYDVLEELPQDVDLNDFARNIIEQENVERRAVIKMEMMGDMEIFPAYTTDCSSDLTEYVAAQDIPNFGVHAYYAISKQPVNKWQRADMAILPKGTKSAIETSITAPAATPESPPKQIASAPEVEEAAAKSETKMPEKKKRRPRKLGQSPPTHPMGEVRQPQEERITPTWGTNLVNIRETTTIGHIEEPSDEAKALQEEVSRQLDEEERDAEEEEAGSGQEDTIASKAKDMLVVVDEFQHGKMDKSKIKVPSRLTKLGDRSGIKAPKSLKAPKIPVKGMKKGQKGKGVKFGPKPANLPAEYAQWTEKDLEEEGLTWNDLIPVDENIDDELQRIEDEMMAGDEEGDMPIEELHFDMPERDFDLDAMLREAEAELAADRSAYDEGIEEDESVLEMFEDEIEELEDEMNVSRAAEESLRSSPAITSRIPVTTPKRSISPTRVKAPERFFAQDDEDEEFLARRESPLRPPKEKRKDTSAKRKRSKRGESSDKDPNISRVFKKAKKAVRGSPQAEEGDDDEDAEFERLERQFEQGEPGPSSRCSPCPRQRSPEFAPGESERTRQRAMEQEQQLRSPAPDYDMFADQYAGAAPCMRRASPAAYASPPRMPEDEFEMLDERMYQDQAPGAQPQGPDEFFEPDDRFGFMYDGQDPGLDQYQPNMFEQEQPQMTPDRYPTQLEQARTGRQMREAEMQEMLLRHGSPEANRIIEEAQMALEDDLMEPGEPEPQPQERTVCPRCVGRVNPVYDYCPPPNQQWDPREEYY